MNKEFEMLISCKTVEEIQEYINYRCNKSSYRVGLYLWEDMFRGYYDSFCRDVTLNHSLDWENGAWKINPYKYPHYSGEGYWDKTVVDPDWVGGYVVWFFKRGPKDSDIYMDYKYHK